MATVWIHFPFRAWTHTHADKITEPSDPATLTYGYLSSRKASSLPDPVPTLSWLASMTISINKWSVSLLWLKSFELRGQLKPNCRNRKVWCHHNLWLLGVHCLPTSLVIGVTTACTVVVAFVISFVVVCFSRRRAKWVLHLRYRNENSQPLGNAKIAHHYFR